jgi:hypothetical protein
MTRKNSNADKLNDDPEFGVDSRYQSRKEQGFDSSSLMETRLAKMRNLSKDQISKAKLMQLKFKMEEFIKQPVYDDHNHFSMFLASYIDSIYPKRNVFAKDIDISTVSLSQIINNHREPKDEFIKKLMVHSEKVYSNICEFDTKTWFQVFFLEKICDTMSSQKEWKPLIEKQVKVSGSID